MPKIVEKHYSWNDKWIFFLSLSNKFVDFSDYIPIFSEISYQYFQIFLNGIDM